MYYTCRDCVAEDLTPQWSGWVDYDSCTKACSGGIKMRVRKCDNPPADPTVAVCQGSPENPEPCNTDPCPEPFGNA